MHRIEASKIASLRTGICIETYPCFHVVTIRFKDGKELTDEFFAETIRDWLLENPEIEVFGHSKNHFNYGTKDGMKDVAKDETLASRIRNVFNCRY